MRAEQVSRLAAALVDCSRRNANMLSERCDLICPDLPKAV
jgi:hypothetical protein